MIYVAPTKEEAGIGDLIFQVADSATTRLDRTVPVLTVFIVLAAYCTYRKALYCVVLLCDIAA